MALSHQPKPYIAACVTQVMDDGMKEQSNDKHQRHSKRSPDSYGHPMVAMDQGASGLMNFNKPVNRGFVPFIKVVRAKHKYNKHPSHLQLLES